MVLKAYLQRFSARFKAHPVKSCLVALVIVIVLLQLATYVIQPTSVTFTYYDPNGAAVPIFASSDPSVVSQWYSDVNSQPPTSQFGHCASYPASYTPESALIVFSFYGIPIEEFDGANDANVSHTYTKMNGILPDVFDIYCLTLPQT